MKTAALLFCGLCAPLACGVDWNVRLVNLMDRKAAGERAKLSVAANGVSIERRNGPRIGIPVESISGVIYRASRYSRGGAMIEDAPPSGDPLETLWGVAGLGLIHSKASNHYIVLSWVDSGDARQEILEAGKKDYKSILSALEALTGKPAIDGAVATAVTGAPLAHSYDAGDGWRIPLRRIRVDGAPALCFPAQHLHGFGGGRFDCAGWLCVGEKMVVYRPGPGGKPEHALRVASADLARQRPAADPYYLTLRAPKKFDFALISQRGASSRRETDPSAAAEPWALFWRAVADFAAVRSELMLDK